MLELVPGRETKNWKGEKGRKFVLLGFKPVAVDDFENSVVMHKMMLYSNQIHTAIQFKSN